METAQHDAQQNELYRHAAPWMTFQQQQPFTVTKPMTADTWPGQQQQPGSVANSAIVSTAATVDLSRLTPAQLLALQQQQGALLTHSSMVSQQQQQQQPLLHQPRPQQQILPLLHTPSPQLSLPTMTLIPPIPTASPTTPLIYNGVNPNYPGLRVVNRSPPMFAVDQFLTPSECQFLMHAAHDSLGPAPVVGKGAGEISQARTSSTCYLAREDLAQLMRKVCCLTGKPLEHCELPQVGQYLATQQYLQHYDAFDLETEDGRRFAANGGQRTITVLIYLNTVQQGGQTSFPMLNIDVQPQQGMALVFFPASIDGMLDRMVLHAAKPAVDVKYVSQVWIRQSTYHGQASKRLAMTMGPPLMPGECGGVTTTPVVNASLAQQQPQWQTLQQQPFLQQTLYQQ